MLHLHVGQSHKTYMVETSYVTAYHHFLDKCSDGLPTHHLQALVSSSCDPTKPSTSDSAGFTTVNDN